MLSALQSDTNTEVLSAPNLLTLDNEEAEIMVGENIPIPAGYGGYGGMSSLSGIASMASRAGLTWMRMNGEPSMWADDMKTFSPRGSTTSASSTVGAGSKCSLPAKIAVKLMMDEA